jgi:integrase
VVLRDFVKLEDARIWIFGDAQNEKANPGPVIALKQKAGAAAFDLSPSQIAEAAAAIRELGETGSLTEAVRFYLKHAKPQGGTRSIPEAISELINAKAKAGRSERHLKGLRWNLEKFGADFPKLNMNQIRRHHAEHWLDRQHFSLKTRANYIRDLNILFNFAHSRRWVAENPCASIEKPSTADGEVIALTSEECAKLLLACPEPFLPGVCIKLFAGLRTSELLALDWSQVSETEIIVRGLKAKTRQRRVVTISDNLAQWLLPHRKTIGRVAPFEQNAWHRSLESIAEKAAITLPSNVLRHSFGSYHFAQHRNENLTAAEMGNSPAMVFQHYRAVVTSEASAKFWSLLPTPAENVVKFAVRSTT